MPKLMNTKKVKKVSRTYRLNPETISLLKQVQETASFITNTQTVEGAITNFCNYLLNETSKPLLGNYTDGNTFN